MRKSTRWRTVAFLALCSFVSTHAALAAVPDFNCMDKGCHVLAEDGSMFGWGESRSGQLGFGGRTSKFVPTRIPGKYKSFSSGRLHVIAVREDGTLWVWGWNNFGQLGVPTATAGQYDVPTQVGTDTDWVAVGAGDFFSAAVKSNGSLWTWGENAFGQLGDGLTVTRPTPTQVGTDVQVGTDSAWVAIEGGSNHAIAMKADGTVWTWGRGANGQLGHGNSSDTPNPTQVSTILDATAVSAGTTSSAYLSASGGIKTWGINSSGQLGDGTTTSRNVPTSVAAPGTGSWSELKMNKDSVGAIDSSGNLWVWGAGGSNRLGDGLTANRTSPFQLPGVTQVIANSFGVGFGGALFANGAVKTWGLNSTGQLGNNTSADVFSPQLIGGADTYTKVSGGRLHSLALRSDGRIVGWGDNAGGQLGLGNNTAKILLPTLSANTATNWTHICGGNVHTLALNSTGQIFATGGGGFGQLGNGGTANINALTQIGAAVTWSAMACAAHSSVGIDNLGKLYTWGLDDAGQLGNGPALTSNVTTPIQVGESFKAACGGGRFVLAQKTDGSLWSFGAGGKGSLGLGDQVTLADVPTQIGTSTDWDKIACAEEFSVATKTDGSLWVWGDNSNQQFDSLTTDDIIWVPTKLDDSTDWSAISAGLGHMFAIRASDKALFGLGLNDSGEVGVGSNQLISGLQQIGSPGAWNAARADWIHSAGISSDGLLYGWGDNENGEAGINQAAFSTLSSTLGFNSKVSSSGQGAFGNVTAGTTATQTFELVNGSSGSVNISATVEGAGFSIVNNGCASVASQGSCSVTVQFSPISAVAALGTFTFSGSLLGGGHDFALTATGVAAPTPTPTPNPEPTPVPQPQAPTLKVNKLPAKAAAKVASVSCTAPTSDAASLSYRYSVRFANNTTASITAGSTTKIKKKVIKKNGVKKKLNMQITCSYEVSAVRSAESNTVTVKGGK
jgi:alpha-tubulin suppressor-like RCC1 family protein